MLYTCHLLVQTLKEICASRTISLLSIQFFCYERVKYL